MTRNDRVDLYTNSTNTRIMCDNLFMPCDVLKIIKTWLECNQFAVVPENWKETFGYAQLRVDVIIVLWLKAFKDFLGAKGSSKFT